MNMADNRFDFPEGVVKPGSPEAGLLEKVDPESLPRHIAVIMDGNGRWARQRGLPRVMGHREGVKSVREIVESCARLGIEVLTIFAFSVENWKRPQSEIDSLMKMLSEFLKKETSNLIKNGIKFQPIGRWHELPDRTVVDIEKAIEATAGGTNLLFQVALNYGGRVEIVDACRQIAADVLSGSLEPQQIDLKTISERLYSPEIPDPDLLIRTSGEFRVSNFLLWEIVYTEIHVTPRFWPDFRLPDLLEAIIDFQQRERRFGGLNGDTE